MINGIFFGVIFTFVISLCTAKVFIQKERTGNFIKLFLICFVVYGNFFIEKELRAPFYYFLPWVAVSFLFFIDRVDRVDKKYMNIYLLSWMIISLILGLIFTKIMVLPEVIDVNRTVLADHSIKKFASIHFGETGSTTLRIKLFLFEIYLYLYAILRRLFDYFTIWNVSNIFGFGGLLALIVGIKELVIKMNKTLITIFIGNLSVLAFILMISRSIDEKGMWVIISPIFVYVSLLATKKISIPLILGLQIVWLMFMRIYV